MPMGLPMRLSISLVFLAAVLAGCATYPRGELIPFSPALVEHYQLASDEVLRLQYFLSRELVLESRSHAHQHGVVSGRLVSERDRQVERLIIPAGTPGVAIASQDGVLQVSFGEGSQLTFQPTGEHAKSPYRLLAETSRPDAPSLYAQGQTYRVVSGMPLPYLAINREVLQRERRSAVRLTGRTLDTP
jgi:hypothetical protein